MYKIVIIGEKDDILPYQSIGVEIEAVKTTEETVNILRKTVMDSSVGIILITEDVAELCLDTITDLRNKTVKAITIIPTQQGSRHTGTMELSKEIGRAVGMNILVK
ncbi:MAG: V-type ATP synthase subunit F [Candidatus Brocadia sp.]|jgi:vacuolar-type H+-ATPase subunit F/Vma7